MSRNEAFREGFNLFREKIANPIIQHTERFVDIVRRPQMHKEELLKCSSRALVLASIPVAIWGLSLSDEPVNKCIGAAAIMTTLGYAFITEQIHKW